MSTVNSSIRKSNKLGQPIVQVKPYGSHHTINESSYNKSLQSDVDSLKSSLKQDSCDILSNSDKSSNEQHKKMSIMAHGLFTQSDRDYLSCKKMKKIMTKIESGKRFNLNRTFRGDSNFR